MKREQHPISTTFVIGRFPEAGGINSPSGIPEFEQPAQQQFSAVHFELTNMQPKNRCNVACW
jgi:hypothetical protein